MKYLLFFVIFVICSIITTYGYPVNEEIVLYESDGDENGYSFQFETSDGIARIEKGQLKPDKEGGQSLSVEGTYTYDDGQGHKEQVSYIADENGYRVKT